MGTCTMHGIMSNSDKQDQDSQIETSQEASDSVAADVAEETLAEAPLHACSNCGSELNGHFCAICGQPNKEIRRPFYLLLAEVLHVLLDLDGRAYRSVFFLFTRPAFLSKAYVNGQRANYTAPLRLFIAISITFFIYISVQSAYDSLRESMNEIEAAASPEVIESEALAVNAEEDGTDDSSSGGTFQDEDEEVLDWLLPLIDRINIPFVAEQTNANLHAVLRSQAEENYAELEDDPVEALFNLLEYVTVFILLMIPVLAFMQFIVFFFARRYFIEHLVLTLHNHTFVILVFLIISLLSIVEDADILILSATAGVASTLTLIWIPIYLLLSLKFYFNWGWLFTIPLYILLSLSYAVTMGMSIVAFALILFLFS